MIGLEDRQLLAREIDSANRAGARLHLACEVAGIDARTLQRWKAHQGLVKGDARPGASRPLPAHALSPEERAQVLHVANEPRFADLRSDGIRGGQRVKQRSDSNRSAA